MSADTVTPPPAPPQLPPVTPSAPTAPTAPPVSHRRRWFRRFLPLLTLLVVSAWFLPAIVANTGLRNHLARRALADLHGSVDVGGASLGWFAPLELRDVTLKDEAGRTVVSVPKITTQKSLLDLARNPADPGEITLEGPTIALVCEKNATNLETALAEYLKDDGRPARPTRVPVAVRVSGGQLTLTDAENGKTTSVENLAATVSAPANRSEPVAVAFTSATGGVSAELVLGDAGSAKLVSTGLALDTFAPLLKRLDPNLSLAGAVTTDLQLSWGKDATGRPRFAVAGTAGAKQLVVSAPWLNGDTLRLDSAELPLNVEVTGSSVSVQRFDLACDVGTVSIAGTFDPNEPTEQLLMRPGVTARASIELSRLAAKVPKLLRVKGGTELREGKVALTLTSQADPSGVVWQGHILTSAIRAVRDGKVIHWEQPLHVEFTGRYASGQVPTFDKFVCTSDFIAVNAKTTPETVQAAATVLLNRLGERLAEFLDLGGATLAGEATVQLVGRREPTGAFKAEGAVVLKDFAITDHNGRGLKEPALTLKLKATGRAPASGPVQLATASVGLSADGDELNLTLLEPVADVRALASGAVDLTVRGDLTRWKARIAAVTAVPAYEMGGTAVVSGKARFAADRITVERLTVGLTNAKFRGAGVFIDEPILNATGDFTLVRSTGVATVAALTLNSAPLSVTNGTLTFELKTDLAVSGDGQCVTDLNRLGATLKLYADPRGPDAFYGRGAGPVRFRYAGDVTTFAATLDVTNFAYGPKEKLVWAEPALRLEANGNYADSADAVTLTVARAERPGLALDAKGQLARITTTQDLNFSGSLRYDWAKLTPLAREFLGATFNATGTGTRALALSGQLAPATAPPAAPPGGIVLRAPGELAGAAAPSVLVGLRGEAALGWDTLKAHGFDVGTGELKTSLARGVLTVAPVTATFGGGKVTLAPTVKLDPAPGVLTLAKGPVVEHAKLTPQATSGALGYALPAFANATQAEGELSATIDDNRIPLADATQATLKGTLVIHKAQVGAGPVVAELAKLLGANTTTMTLATDTAVPVQVANARVYHQNFAFKISGTTLHTSGSVGFDNTLDLVIDVPLPKDLPALKNNPLLMKAVAGKVIKVPVKGTLTKPMIDAKAFESAVVALARQGAKDAGKDALDKELNKLFPGAVPGTNPKSGGSPFPLPFGKNP
ncbi:AsmA family protein [Frigoriglobus tundricola]|uniref:AsmA-like C-terminal domain-containing protein n=1 Tax=Frigoriglobus tundricola TaxID=2774151 RepID=A0A6M5YJP9_9BACT|nr:hypothetical protein [Frigoriglobus tundricola]QJW93570.1 hypothetical protein FTUN_1077 [Frigoriglobus tundricola]